MTGRFTTVVVVLLSLYVTTGSSWSDHKAQNLVSCLHGVSQLLDSPTVDQLESALEYCEDAFYDYTDDGVSLSQKIKYFLGAVHRHFEHRLINEAKEYLYDCLDQIINGILDEDKINELHNFMDKTGRAYAIFQQILHGRIKDRFIKRTAIIGLLYNPVTTSATKRVINWAKYGNYVGIAADAAEFGLGMMGCESQGKVVGAVGNTASGAMTGFSVAGPPGAAIGAGVGLLLWYW